MQVIKLGGSLEKSKQLVDCLNYIANNIKGRVVIVAGGGLFADGVRLAQQQWQFNDVIAHEMAILAMQQMALLFNGIRPDFKRVNLISEICSGTQSPRIIIWSPEIAELNQAAIKASWDITSDSLAAWLAAQLQASQLTLVKAADFSQGNIAQLTEQGIIDNAFSKFIENAGFKTLIISADKFHE
ncbi:MAG: uridylate kinase [Methylococcaceae bacterium]|nr:uridylate kinase [Methylococcaceae bacterium]